MVAPITLIYILNTFEIVKMPTVTRTDENGEEVQESFFSAGGAAGLKDLLTGDAKKRKADAEKLRRREGSDRRPRQAEQPEAERPRRARGGQAQGAGPQPRRLLPGGRSQEARCRRSAGTAEDNPGSSVNTSGLSAEAVVEGGGRQVEGLPDLHRQCAAAEPEPRGGQHHRHARTWGRRAR